MVVGGNRGVYGFPSGRFINIVGDKSAGKAQPLYSNVLTPNGWVRMGDIHCGDEVCTPDGGVANVIGEFPQGKRKVYRFHMSDNTYVDSADNHYWVVQSPNQMHSETTFDVPNGESLVTTQDIVDLSNNQGLNVPANRLFLPKNESLNFNNLGEFEIPPYLMGILLADGGLTSNPTVTIVENDILDKVSNMLLSIGYELNCTDDKITYRLSCIEGKRASWIPEYIRELGLDCKSVDKHIPRKYLFSSISDRIELLHGMFDGDGSVSKGGNCIYYTSSKQLADDFAFLVRSLGGYASISKVKTPFYIKNNERVYCHDSYSVYMRFENNIRPFTSKKHADRYVEGRKGYRWKARKAIDSVEYLGEFECKCIYIAHPRHLYITDGFNVTHNTFLSNEIIAWAYHNFDKKKFKWVYDDCESGYSFDTESMYGFEIMPDNPIHSTTVEEAFCNISDFADKLKGDQFGIYVLDSLDALTSQEQDDRAEERLKAFHNDKIFDKGTYGMGKQKYLSQEFFPQLCSKIQDKNILVIIISQIRENVDMFSFEKFSRSGGKAMDFYAHTVLWLATAKKIEKKDRPVGVVVKAKVTKSKTPRPFRECFFSFLYDYGLDGIGTSVDYLFDLRTPKGELNTKAKAIQWSGDGRLDLNQLREFLIECDLTEKYEDSRYYEGKYVSDDIFDFIQSKKDYREKFNEKFGSTMTRDELIEWIENENKEDELEERVENKWEDFEESLKSNRKKKYGTQPKSGE